MESLLESRIARSVFSPCAHIFLSQNKFSLFLLRLFLNLKFHCRLFSFLQRGMRWSQKLCPFVLALKILRDRYWKHSKVPLLVRWKAKSEKLTICIHILWETFRAGYRRQIPKISSMRRKNGSRISPHPQPQPLALKWYFMEMLRMTPKPETTTKSMMTTIGL